MAVTSSNLQAQPNVEAAVSGSSKGGWSAKRTLAQTHWQLKLFVGVAAACMVGYFGYVIAYGVNVVFWDDWAWESFLLPAQPTLATLAAQHTENIMFFPSVLAFLLIRLTHWNSIAFFWLSAVLLSGVLVLVARVFWNQIRQAPLLWLPLPFLVLTLAQYQNTLWAFQIAWFMALLAIVSATVLLGKANISVSRLICAAVIGVVGSFSLIQGLLVWPAGLIILMAKGRSNKARVIWCAIAIVVMAGYFSDLDFGATGSAPLSYIVADLSGVFQGVLVAAGSVIPNTSSGISAISSSIITEIVGGILLAAGVGVVATWIVQRRPQGPKAFCVALIVTSILFDLMLIPSRLAVDTYYGTTSRYDTFMWPLLVGTYSYVIMSRPSAPKPRVWARAPQMLLSLAVLAEITIGTMVGINQGQVTRAVRLTSVDVLANWKSAPPAVAAPYLFPPCANDPVQCTNLKAEARLLATDHMSIFGNPSRVHLLRALGIVPGGVAGKPLTVPPTLRAQVRASQLSQNAWNVLGAVYRSNRSLQLEYPQTKQGILGLLRWAIASGGQVTGQAIIAAEWYPPVSADFFLLQYNSVYRSWALSGNS